MLAILVYYAATTITLLYTRAGDAAFASNHLVQAQKNYDKASLFQPHRMELLISQARLNVLLDQKVPPQDSFAKFIIDFRLQNQLAELQQKYPYVAYPYLLQIQFYQNNQKRFSGQWYCHTKKLYQKVSSLIQLDKTTQDQYLKFLQRYGNKPC